MATDIVIYDDASTSLRPLYNALHAAGYVVEHTTNIARNTAAFSDDPTELVFISLRRKDAIPLCETLRQDPAGAIVPILFVGSGQEPMRSPIDALEAGGDFYYQHPLQLDTVIARVQTYVRPSQQASIRPHVSASASASAITPPNAHLDGHRRVIYQLLDTARRADYFTLLGLAPHAGTAAIEHAYRQQRDRIGPDQLDPSVHAELAGALSEIRTILHDAWDVLSDPTLRTAYSAYIQHPVPLH